MQDKKRKYGKLFSFFILHIIISFISWFLPLAARLVTKLRQMQNFNLRIKKDIMRTNSKKRRGRRPGFLIEFIPIKDTKITQSPKLIKCMSEEAMALFFA